MVRFKGPPRRLGGAVWWEAERRVWGHARLWEWTCWDTDTDTDACGLGIGGSARAACGVTCSFYHEERASGEDCGECCEAVPEWVMRVSRVGGARNPDTVGGE
ncbi:hypothetical protein PLESTB_000506800 [Pleodorina starrii]|uniref:Uncharacterized protein n=1 Tax=Pleodorina starrii TaxID=330485 RepID=A0A9W6F062_9CHLO|nr:hypothetical protein PLESTM_000121600 [Pleodorina starrii]GLC51477.1 hypothetical protein PLESTB_000506800 [Pleodorina starrii]GLC67705.1 hypothetical protein PLESTF_000596600 [Pleodorina starrii]